MPERRQGGAGGTVVLQYATIYRYLRGAEVIEIRDEEGQLFNDFRGRVRPEDAHKLRVGTKRTLLLALDTAQYQLDVNALEQDGPCENDKGVRGVDRIYGAFNVLQRRKAKENNFKAVLESIRDLMDDEGGIPEWMHDLFLGYGDPADAQYPVRCLP
jgi:intron-binding protein aquarius